MSERSADPVRLLQLAQTAVSSPIEFLEATFSLAETLGCSLEKVHDWAAAMSITGDNGMELTGSDLAALLDAADSDEGGH